MKRKINTYPGGVINEKGNNMNLTMRGYGSVTPPHVIQKMIDGMTQKQIAEMSDRCDEWQAQRKLEGKVKFAWKNPVFKKKFRNWNPFSNPWRVDEGDWTGGHFEFFKTLEEAIKYAKRCTNIFVDIENTITEERFRVRDLS